MPEHLFSAKSPPRKAKNTARRDREYLTASEVEKLTVVAGKLGRHSQRDATLILMMYRHGLRVAEAISLRWEAVDLDMAQLHVRRVKHGVAAVHPLRGKELRALRKLKRDYPGKANVFVSERGGPLTARTVHHSALNNSRARVIVNPFT